MNPLFLLFFFLPRMFNQGTTNEQVYFENEWIRITYHAQRCTFPDKGVDNEYLILRIENLTNRHITVSFYKNLWYDGKCQPCGKHPENFVAYALEPRQTLSGDCMDRGDGLVIFARMRNATARSLTRFEFDQIEIK